MLGPDGARLAKRHGAVTLADRAALGEAAADVRAGSLRSVWPRRRVPRTAALLARFDPAALPREPTHAGGLA